MTRLVRHSPSSLFSRPYFSCTNALALAGLGLALLASPAAHAQNLVTNPGFETGDFTGWTITGPVQLDDTSPHAGFDCAGFNGTNQFGDLSQSIATTVGTTYDVSFFLQNDNGPDNEFKASFAGFQVLDVVNANAFPYTEYSFPVTATSTTSRLDFTGFQDPGRFRLDDISVTPAAVPEASTTASFGLLLALGLGGLVIAAKRKKTTVKTAA